MSPILHLLARLWQRERCESVSQPAPGTSHSNPESRSTDAQAECFSPDEVVRIDVERDFGERVYPLVFALLQRGPRSTLLDLRAAEVIKTELFDRLADAWRAPPGTVPRLGIVLRYEHWVVFRRIAARNLKPLAEQGVEVEIFYAQQYDSLGSWFSTGDIRHDQLPLVVEWLRTAWSRTAIWPLVLNTTAMLVAAEAEPEHAPDLLIELATIARTFDGDDGDPIAEGCKLAKLALMRAGEKPSGARCRALRALAAAVLRRADHDIAVGHLEEAVTTAEQIGDQMEEASAHAEIGQLELQRGRFGRAEASFRRALMLVGATDPPFLRAALHHDLARTLLARGGDRMDAERHATAALELRWAQDSSLADADRELLTRIRDPQS